MAQNQLSWKNLNFVFVKENLNLQLEKEKNSILWCKIQ